MSKIAFNSEHQAITQTCYLLREIEENAKVAFGKETSSIFDLLTKYSTAEKKVAKELSLLQKINFYFFNYYPQYNKTLQRQIQHEDFLKQALVLKLSLLSPPKKIYENIENIFFERQTCLEKLGRIHTTIGCLECSIRVATIITLGYLAYQFLKTDVFNSLKVVSNISFDRITIQSFATSLCVLGSALLYLYKGKIISKIFSSTVLETKQQAFNILQKVSHIKDFLIDYAVDPTFIRPIFQKASNE